MRNKPGLKPKVFIKITNILNRLLQVILSTLTGPDQNQATHEKARFQKNLAFFRFSGIPYLPFTTSQLPLLMNGLSLLLRMTPIDEKQLNWVCR
jgi:hypothetical protein